MADIRQSRDRTLEVSSSPVSYKEGYGAIVLTLAYFRNWSHRVLYETRDRSCAKTRPIPFGHVTMGT